jgi:hypothetical protein
MELVVQNGRLDRGRGAKNEPLWEPADGAGNDHPPRKDMLSLASGVLTPSPD